MIIGNTKISVNGSTIHPFAVRGGSFNLLSPVQTKGNIVGQQIPTLYFVVTCYVPLDTLLHVYACCCVLLGVVAQSLTPVKLLDVQTDATTPNTVGPTMLEVITTVCTLLYYSFVTGLFLNAFPQSRCITTKFIL